MKIIKKLPKNFHLNIKNIYFLVKELYETIFKNKIDKFQYYLVKIYVVYHNNTKKVCLTKCFRLEHDTLLESYVIALVRYLKDKKKFNRCITEIHFNIFLKKYNHDYITKKYNIYNDKKRKNFKL